MKPALEIPWLIAMAWRDSRNHRKKLLLYISSIILGAAALVAIRSLGDNMEAAINSEARTLLGADLSVSRGQAFPEQVTTFLDSLGGDRSEQTSFSSMLFIPGSGQSRLVQTRALGGVYPYYGVIETDPPEAANRFQRSGQALVDDGLMIQYGLEVGDTVRLGAVDFAIAGRLLKIPGETLAMSAIGPRVYIPMDSLEATGLVQAGSRINYRVYMKFERNRDIEQMAAAMKPLRERFLIQTETVEDRKRQIGRSLGNLYRFLNLGGFIALILGSVGVASAVNTYVKQKIDTVAVLRCLGASARQTFLIYLIQAGFMGLVGATLGVAVGGLALLIFPLIIGDFLPIEMMSVSLSPFAVVQGVGISLIMALLFALLPLLSIRGVSPLLTIRASYEPYEKGKRDPWRFAVYFLLVASVLGFAISQTRFWMQGVGFTAGLVGAFLLLNLIGSGVIRGVQWLFRDSWNYTLRQGMANLFRPHNQTVMMVVSLGLGSFLLTVLFLLHNSLITHLTLTGSRNQPNMVIFDIQTDQVDALRALLQEKNLEIMQEVPVVTMRIGEINGKTVETLRNDSPENRSNWPLRREYRSTYRNGLLETETLIAGRFTGTVDPSVSPAPVSLERDIAEELQVGLGDEIVFDVQGIPIRTVVGSLREVNWQRVQPNFFVVFPEGVLEAAPQFHVVVTRTDDATLSAETQRAVVTRFPNMSIIDLTLILSTLDVILDKVGLVIRFMAFFSVFTGLIVLIGVVTNSRYQRVRESILLKTLGGTRRQILRIMIVEYLLLGFIAGITGVILSLAGGWALTRWVFEITFYPDPIPTLAVIAAVALVTVIVGMLASRGIHERAPLEILRAEG